MFKLLIIGVTCLIFLCANLIKPVSVCGQSPGGCLAVITELAGDVSVFKANSKKVDATWGLQLFEGDKIKTARGSAASLLFSNGNLINLGANSNISISDNKTSRTDEGKARNVNKAMIANFSALTSKRKKEKEKDLGLIPGLRAVSSSLPIELVSPCNTIIAEICPAFSWTTDKTMDEFELKLFSTDSLIWKSNVQGKELDYPADAVNLEYGKTYFWYVTGEAMLESYKSISQEFTVIESDKLEEVKTQQANLATLFDNNPESGSYHSLLGALYMSYGLTEMAIEEFIKVSEFNPEASLPHEILGRLYTSAGKKDRAILELQKALELNKTEE